MEWNTSMTGAKMTPKSLNLSSVSGRTPISARRKSILASSKKSAGRFSSSSRAAQSQKVIAVTAHHIVESYGVSLPVLVTEALNYADRCTVGSVRISPCGWAWLVTGRRLFVWQYRHVPPQSSGFADSAGRRWTMTGQCRELNLPPSDLSHKADLVCIISGEGNHVPSCVAVTPEGIVRYWPSITHEGTSVEDNADLQVNHV
ncbi:hypothetical protein J437_LFUL009305 [Ladona fulva]|uniref:Nucleoporin Nup133/Nup155-like N-terminal domain-containing protein n=1 Tax=Ladona fulva TaxID=123851 RepID=A0A8K0K7E3_LADFU|nr:hypothetical protein J437_LFUL009305 [Ladona fulva]